MQHAMFLTATYGNHIVHRGNKLCDIEHLCTALSRVDLEMRILNLIAEEHPNPPLSSGNRHDRLPVRTVLAARHWAQTNGTFNASLVQRRPDRTIADLRGILVCRLAHHGFLPIRR